MLVSQLKDSRKLLKQIIGANTKPKPTSSYLIAEDQRRHLITCFLKTLSTPYIMWSWLQGYATSKILLYVHNVENLSFVIFESVT